MYRHFHDTNLYEYGVVVHHAVNAPKELKKLEPKYLAAEQINPDTIPAMLRIPKKREVESNGG